MSTVFTPCAVLKSSVCAIAIVVASFANAESIALEPAIAAPDVPIPQLVQPDDIATVGEGTFFEPKEVPTEVADAVVSEAFEGTVIDEPEIAYSGAAPTMIVDESIQEREVLLEETIVNDGTNMPIYASTIDPSVAVAAPSVPTPVDPTDAVETTSIIPTAQPEQSGDNTVAFEAGAPETQRPTVVAQERRGADPFAVAANAGNDNMCNYSMFYVAAICDPWKASQSQ